MSDATAAINTPFLESPYDLASDMIVKSAKTLFQGIGVAIGSDGNLVKSSESGALYTLGVAEQTIVGDGVLTCRVRQGIARFANDAGHLLSIANRLGPCYWTDDQTVGTDSSKLLAGIVYDVRADGVYVLVGAVAPANAAVGALLAANNLNDVLDAAAAAENLGLGVTDSPTMTGPTFTGATKAKGAVIAGGAAYTVLDASGDHTVVSATDNAVITLPDTAAGNKAQRVTVQCTAAAGAAKLSVSPHSSDKIYGGIYGAATGTLVTFAEGTDKDIILTKATQLKGDFVTLQSDGATGWWVVGGKGVWASEA